MKSQTKSARVGKTGTEVAKSTTIKQVRPKSAMPKNSKDTVKVKKKGTGKSSAKQSRISGWEDTSDNVVGNGIDVTVINNWDVLSCAHMNGYDDNGYDDEYDYYDDDY